MKKLPAPGGWVLLFMAAGVVLLGPGATIHGQEKAASEPEYLKTARYLTSAKCKMCHTADKSFPNWEKTRHAQLSEAFPWEKTEEKPAPEQVYRHVTGYDATAGTWAEKGIGCEACHGPGSAHLTAKKDSRKATILHPARFDTAARKISVCGRCHGQYTIGEKRFAETFLPGQDLPAMPGFKLDPVEAGKKFQQLNEVVASKHFAQGVVCTTCHTAHAETALEHRLRKPVNALCLDCHAGQTMATHAPKAAEGATCATCHMPGGAHTFAKPPGE